jgi:hypothetical protein
MATLAYLPAQLPEALRRFKTSTDQRDETFCRVLEFD